MKKSKKLLALAIAFLMTFSVVAACDTTDEGEDGTSTTTQAATTTTGEEETTEEGTETEEPIETDEPSDEETTEEETNEEETTEPVVGEVEPVRIVQPGNLPIDYDNAIVAINEKLINDGTNLEVEIIRIPWDAYDQRLNLMLTTGDAFEMLHIMQDVKNLSNIAGMGALVSLEGLIDKYPNLQDRFTDLEWQGTLYNGEVYAVPCFWRSFDNTMSYITVRTDVMKAVGYEEFPDDSIDDFIDMSKKMQEYITEETGVRPYHWFHQPQDTAHWLHRTYDSYPFYVENSIGMVMARQDGTIDSFYESEEFKNDANTYRRMFQEGLINPDILSLDHSYQYEQSRLGAFLPSQTFDPGEEVNIREATGIETTIEYMKMAADKPELKYTFVQNLNAISATSDNPESGLKFLDWLYDSQENHDLFHFGVEGTHFTAIGDDRLEYIRDEETNNPLFTLDTWMTGYMPYMRYSADAPDAYIEGFMYEADNYVVSPIAGFIFDSSEVQSQLTNLQTEIIASIYPIKMGMVDYEENIDGAIDRLKAAGLDAYLDEYRSQFADYLEANPWVLEMAPGTTGD